MTFINSFFSYLGSILATFQLADLIDILLVAYLIYKAFQLVRETRAEQLVKGILLLILAYYLSQLLSLKAMSFILLNIMQFGLIALVVVFQPELRSVLERLGSTRVGKFGFINLNGDKDEAAKNQEAILAVCEAAETLQKNRIGALILFERRVRIGEIVKTGTLVNANISPQLVVNLFYPKSPLHDGAVIIREGRIHAAGCFLPLSQNQEISRELGTRHRAALGISENSDVIVVVVSEENGIISLVEHGVIKRSMTIDTLRIALEQALIPRSTGNEKKTGFRKFGK